MLGVALSLATAVCKTATDVSIKYATQYVRSDAILLFVQRVVETLVPLAVIGVLVYFGSTYDPRFSHITTPYFLLLLIGSVTLNGLAFYVGIRALRLSDVAEIELLFLFLSRFEH